MCTKQWWLICINLNREEKKKKKKKNERIFPLDRWNTIILFYLLSFETEYNL